MAITIARRAVLAAGAAGAFAVVTGGRFEPLLAAQPATQPAKKVRPPAIEPELVRAFVGAAHGDLDKTRAMLDERPGLLNAVWDWGGGDFEAAIGGAGHMGRYDIAEFLIGRGARFDVFVAAMMGKLELVRATIAAFPPARTSLGPHGITLMAHAERGGERAAEVVKYLESLA